MTKELIMIDDVDVSGCDFYNKVIGEDAYCNIDEEHLCTCISYDNCHYKLYKRKEQECDQLKAELEKYKQLANSFEADFYNALSDKESNHIKQLKQALQEIKEIAEVEIECKTYEIENDCFNETRCKALNEHIDFTKQILQKCEVIDEKV